MGHLYRMMTLAGIFKNNGYECVFLLHANKVAEKVLYDNLYSSIITYSSDTDEDYIISSYFNKQPTPFLWIFDILSTVESWIEDIQKHDVPVVCFDDLSGGPRAANLVINAIAGCWKDSPLGDNIVGGPHYAILNPDIEKFKKTRYFATTLPIGISMGGSDTHGATVKIAQALMKTEFGKFYFFLGPHFEHERELRYVCTRLTRPFSFKKNVADLLKELAEMDLVICNGGQTLFELCALGIPALALANEHHEEETICYFVEQGACINLGTVQHGINFTFFRDTLQGLTTCADKMDVLRKNAQKLVDGKGALRCYEECLKLIATSEFMPCSKRLK